MNNKYQIFVSSTYEDLKEERSQVIKAVLEMGHIPVGMEMFSAADEEQWKIITRQIDETDYYVIIVAHRYGTLSDGISYTEKEFDYAISKGIPVYGFMLDGTVQALAINSETDPVKVAALANFKDKVKKRPVSFWKSADDLHGKVAIALGKAFNTTPRAGWTRATAVAGPEVMQELSRLSKENADLRVQLEAAVNQEGIDYKEFLLEKIKTLNAIPHAVCLKKKGGSKYDIIVNTTYFKIFSLLAPEMMNEISIEDASFNLGLNFKPKESEELAVKAPYPINYVSVLFADMASLELVEPSRKKHPVSDTKEYWSLTQTGKDVHKIYRAMQLKSMAKKSEDATSE
ncbi:MAG: DUF4062 domain-containing protein [Proteobacteria bacterium]|nr:DUF4062 domain-containing protein [Pseudomonadota bacterium]